MKVLIDLNNWSDSEGVKVKFTNEAKFNNETKKNSVKWSNEKDGGMVKQAVSWSNFWSWRASWLSIWRIIW